MEKDLVISCFGWHTLRPGNEGREPYYRNYFYQLAKFFQDNGLLKKEIVSSLEDIQNEDEIRKSDLTEEGWQLMKTGYPKWQKRVDAGKPASDTSILDKELQKIRSKMN